MNIKVSIYTHSTYSGHPMFSLIGSYLVLDMPDFGAALSDIEIHLYQQRGNLSKRSLEGPHKEYHQYLGSLPKSRFLKTKCRLHIEYVSRALATAGTGKRSTIDPTIFCEGVKEMVAHLHLAQAKLQKAKPFDCESFYAWLDMKRDTPPLDEAELLLIQQRASEARAARIAAMDEWERLDIEWSEFHPSARDRLPLVFIWSAMDEFGPHGNDTGADVLEMYRAWRKRNSDVSSERFLEKLLRGWEVNQDAEPNDQDSIDIYDNAAIALAFAHLKLEAQCPPAIIGIALESIQRQRERAQSLRNEWSHAGERIEKLESMEKLLK